MKHKKHSEHKSKHHAESKMHHSPAHHKKMAKLHHSLADHITKIAETHETAANMKVRGKDKQRDVKGPKNMRGSVPKY